MTKFIQGLALCEAFFKEIARPILSANFPALRYAAGVIGYGSDVLGFDDALSTDHMWGPRLHLFLPKEGFEPQKDAIASTFSTNFPYEFRGFSTHFSSSDPNDNGVRRQEPIHRGQVHPLVEYHTLRAYFEDYLGHTPFEDIAVSQWLTFTEHRLLGATSGRVFHDDLGLIQVRESLAYYPRDIWLWMMAAQWTMLAEEEAFVGRCGSVGDEVGSKIVATRQVQRIMRLCFLMGKRYAPYSKWFGSAFKQLDSASALLPILELILQASHWREREAYLGDAYTLVADRHNALGLTETLDSATRAYYERPFRVLGAERFAQALVQAIQDTAIQQLAPRIGSVSQFTDSTTVFDNVCLAKRLQKLYQ